MRLLDKSGNKVALFPQDKVSDISENKDSEFDKRCIESWSKLHETPGIFRYPLDVRRERIVGGQHSFILQLNIQRATNRREPESFESIAQKFNPAGFNFHKVRPGEIMFSLTEENDDQNVSQFLVNVSPIDLYHCLFCPEINKSLPQIITHKSLELACLIMFLSSNRNMRLGFNSLGGMASVNHLHYHLIHVDFRLPVETMKCGHLAGPLYESLDYPAKCFCFGLSLKEDIPKICRDIFKVINFLMDNNIAHNLYMTKGNGFVEPENKILRILLWVRTPSCTPKQLSAFNLAICEFSGQIPIKSKYIRSERSSVTKIVPIRQSPSLSHPLFAVHYERDGNVYNGPNWTTLDHAIDYSLESYNTITYEEISKLLEQTTRKVFEKVRQKIISLFA